MLKTLRPVDILTRLSEKGILGKSILKEINNDLQHYLGGENSEENPDL